MKQFNSSLEAFYYWERIQPNAPFLTDFIKGKTQTYSYKTAGREIRKFASALNKYGFAEKSHIAILSKNCAHWVLADLAILMAGHVSVPIYPSLSAESIQQLLEHSESKAIIIGKLENFESQKTGIPDIHKISLKLYGQDEGDHWEDLICRELSPLKHNKLQNDDLQTITYTSSTSNNLKGVMHNVSNFMQSAYLLNTSIKKALKNELPKHLRFFSFLSLAHVTERIGYTTNGLILGGEIYFPESLDTITKNLKVTQPHLFYAVPKVWLQFQKRVLSLFSQKKLDILIKIPGISTLIIYIIKRELGLSKAQFILSGGANLDPDVIKWFETIDIEILQGYGGTEGCMVTHCNLPNANKIGTFGKILPNITTKISLDGEICIKHDYLMTGYYKDKELTATVFDNEGYFKTGDIGAYDRDGYLILTGRKKTIFRTSEGKYISPEDIEFELNRNINVEQSCIIGSDMPHPIALVTLSETGKRKVKQQVTESLAKAIYVLNATLETHEKIEKVIILEEDWTIENNLITQQKKVRRDIIETKYQFFFQSFANKKEESIIWAMSPN